MAPANKRPFRFGVVAPQSATAAEWKELALRAEAQGYSSLLLPDTTGPVLAPFAALGVAAAYTTTLHIGNWVLANDFRNPVIVAREAATLDLLSDGRFELGMGPGRGDNDYASLGMDPATGGTRLRRLGESLQIVRALFRGERVTFSGKYYSIADASLYPVPKKQVPILIAASGPRAIEQAGQYADIVALGTFARDQLVQQVAWLKAAAGARFEELELTGTFFVVPDDDPTAVKALAARVRRFGPDLEALIASKSPNVFVGSTAAIMEQVEERRSTFGVSYIVVGVQDAEAFASVVQRLAGT